MNKTVYGFAIVIIDAMEVHTNTNYISTQLKIGETSMIPSHWYSNFIVRHYTIFSSYKECL